jgi:drug/metabolite transporter (DMT)-like permease
MSLASCLLVSLLWGLTNPFIKRGSEGLKGLPNWRAEIRYLLTTPSFLIPQALNLVGSFLFYALLMGESQISILVPLVNSLVFVWTFLGSWWLESQQIRFKEIVAMSMIIFGASLCADE